MGFSKELLRRSIPVSSASSEFTEPGLHEVLEDEKVRERPIRIFLGGADNYVSIDFCRKYVSRLRRAGKDVQLTEFPGAHRGFDNPLYSPPKLLADAVTTIHYSRREQSAGLSVERLLCQARCDCWF